MWRLTILSEGRYVSDTPSDETRFTDREVREILKRAVERAPSRAVAKSDGLSLAELKTIGAEVGIDAARLDEAAREVAAKGDRRTNPLIGAPTLLRFERTVDGEIDPDDITRVLSVIRRTMGRQGEVTEIGGALEWSATGEAGERHVTVDSRDGSTTVTGSANLTNAALMAYLPGGALGVIVSLIGLTQAAEAESALGLVFFVTMIPLLYLVLRTILRRVTGSESAKLQQVVDELARLTDEPSTGE